ncbi:MAG: hypothetical protein V3S13_00210 [Candidatus Omnitrophota bacterium]
MIAKDLFLPKIKIKRKGQVEKESVLRVLEDLSYIKDLGRLNVNYPLYVIKLEGDIKTI